MRELDKNEAGFSVVEAILILIILATIGFAGWYVYHKNHKTVPASTSKTSAIISSKKPAMPAQQYLDVKEWGIKIPLSSTISDAYYVAATDSTGTMWLGLKSLDSTCAASNANNAGAGGADLALAALVRVAPSDLEPVQGKPYSQLYPGTVIGGYFIGYVSHPDATSCTSATKLRLINTVFSTAVKGIISDTTNKNIVKIPELGIQLTVPDDIKDLTYKIGKTTLRNGNPATYAMFSTASLTAAEPSCGTSFGPFGSLERANGQYPSFTGSNPTPGAPIDYGVLEAQFPMFYISAGFPQAACATNPPPYDRGAFDNSLSTIEPLN